MARFRFAPRAAEGGGGEAGRPSGEAAVLAFCREMASKASALEPAAQACTDEELRARTGAYRERLAGGEAARALLPEAFATVREAATRAVGLRHHDVQVMGGAALHLGMIAEMRTGEGKTLTATLPAYLAALSGQPVHVMTANDYLARRDRDWMQPVYQFLGLTAGLLEPAAKVDIAVRRAQYATDLTYGPWAQFCYDFLRDNLARDLDEVSQRGLGVAIVDEADLILIDEMRSPAMLSGPADRQEDRHAAVARAVGALQPGVHFTVDPAARTASLTEAGLVAIENWFGVENLHDAANGGLAHLVQNAVRALAYERDRDYLVSGDPGDRVVPIDEKSGRPLPSRYADGLHEALEAKEQLPVQPALQTIAIVTARDYLRQYDHLTGMTGTAVTEAPIYRDLYGLEVVTIPANRPVIRVDYPDKLYQTRQSKLAALAADASRRAASGQPVLIGAMSAADAEAVAALLAAAGTGCEVLAARNFEREAHVLAEAGRPGAATIVVKMAGRGVDIILGGAEGNRDAVADKGGLCVLGTERTGDRRTELHLRGRAGRQGDPGESLFYLSAEDQVVASLVRAVPKSMLPRDGTVFGKISKALDKAQVNLTATQAQWYLTNVALDDVLASQQRAFYADRTSVLHEPDMRGRFTLILDQVVTAEVAAALRDGGGPDPLVRKLAQLFGVATARADIARAVQDGGRDPLPAVRRAVKQAYDNREAQVGEGTMRQIERRVLLAVADRAWRAHLAAMSDLLSGLMIRGAGGTQALAEYSREAAALYTTMAARIKLDAVGHVFNLKIEVQQ